MKIQYWIKTKFTPTYHSLIIEYGVLAPDGKLACRVETMRTNGWELYLECLSAFMIKEFGTDYLPEDLN